jgi:hypothetical protein
MQGTIAGWPVKISLAVFWTALFLSCISRTFCQAIRNLPSATTSSPASPVLRLPKCDASLVLLCLLALLGLLCIQACQPASLQVNAAEILTAKRVSPAPTIADGTIPLSLSHSHARLTLAPHMLLTMARNMPSPSNGGTAPGESSRERHPHTASRCSRVA